ncbi:aspartyl/asparaginyl beta-hydroxylase domain-containing protein [Entomobacter blattae]|uniref:Aspartyl/Asparaginyl beta-hydroxylase n=1 Tax=Entomobacter blattae TaxID=2762277 RepID=A0A7H1NPP5_9PROT|nr:aspartyl/asparaginyl beta-hydroxylase domain-containing protein [Entomobacter blattae]QNT77755.1 Aspartyl/Asparaginyl beta-hydroxylase [Entomobacter blattae]
MSKTEAIENSLPKRPLSIRLGKYLRPLFNDLIARSSTVSNDPVLDPAIMPWTAMLEKNWKIIRAELDAVLKRRNAIPPLGQISPDHARIAADQRWQSFFLFGYGVKVEENCKQCPQTTALMKRIPRLNSAFFSILGPGCHIPHHIGVTKGLLTSHLGLIVPKDRKNCRFRIGTNMVHWEEGKTILFDETYDHEVWNDTDETRVVLLIQVERPARFPGNIARNIFMEGVKKSAFVKDAQDNMAEWERAHRDVEVALR